MTKKNLNLVIPIVLVIVLVALGILINVNKASRTPTAEAVNEIISQPFTATANLSLGKLKATAQIGKTAAQKINFIVKEPTALKGLEFSFDGATTTAKYKGLELKLNDDSLLAKSAAAIAVNAINTAAVDSGVEVKLKDDVLLVSGDNDDGHFTLTLDKKTGALLKLTVPSLDFECNFHS